MWQDDGLQTDDGTGFRPAMAAEVEVRPAPRGLGQRLKGARVAELPDDDELRGMPIVVTDRPRGVLDDNRRGGRREETTTPS